MSQDPKPEVIQSDTDSASDAPQAVVWHLPPEFATSSVSKLCNGCKGKTLHEFIVIKPEPVVMIEGYQIEPMELLKLAKRFLICTFCGHMSLTN